MMKFIKDFYYEEDAMGTIEIVIIIAVLVSLALLFKKQLADFATDLMHNMFENKTPTNPKEPLKKEG